jgi:hypothetical protein
VTVTTDLVTFRAPREKVLQLKELAQELGVAMSPLVEGLVDDALATTTRRDLLAAAQAMAKAEGDEAVAVYRSEAWHHARLDYDRSLRRFLELLDRVGL